MNATFKTSWEVFVASDVFAGAPSPEDGERREELAYYIVLETERGDRFRSTWTAATTEFSRRACEALANRHCGIVKAGLKLGGDPAKSSKWMPTSPCYGSGAWTEYGEAEQVAQEKKDAGVW